MSVTILVLADVTRRWTESLVLEYARRATPPDGDVDETAAAILVDADSEALSYLSGRYPGDVLTEAALVGAAVLKQHTAALAMYQLASRIHDQVDVKIINARVDAIAWLRDVAAGRASLGLTTAPAYDITRPEILSARTADDLVMEEALD